jgi:antibiotic biosynthesis monooxygenase (ABM) superfamily enzyme
LIVRTAFFEGVLRPGSEAAFERLLEDTLIPLWRQFPGAEDVSVLRPAAADDGAPTYALVLATRYPDLATMNKALSSDIRELTREPSNRLKSLFDGRVFHITFNGDDLLARAG